jgi:hypothetical protein
MWECRCSIATNHIQAVEKTDVRMGLGCAVITSV